MSSEEKYLSKLEQRKEVNALRSLTTVQGLADFSSNDYLGLARAVMPPYEVRSGSGGSRLLTGNYKDIEHLEQRLAEVCNAESALIFSSGYAANLGVLSCLPQRGDVILYDQLVHASIRDGIRLSNASSYSFQHNDWSDLESKLQKWSAASIYVVLESVYSMDGDSLDIDEIKRLKRKYEFELIVDEAHSFGLFRDDPFQRELGSLATARVVTFGKALGCDGAAVICSKVVRDYLVNFSRPFIYSTAPSPHKVALIGYQLERWSELNDLNVSAQSLKRQFEEALTPHYQLITGSYGNIIGLVIPGNDEVKYYSGVLKEHGFDVRPILSPTVPMGEERLRICFHTFNTEQEVKGMISLLIKLKNKEV